MKVILKHAFILIASVLFFSSCGNGGTMNWFKDAHEIDSINKQNIEMALDFINTYVDNTNRLNEAEEVFDWVNSNRMVTEDFKKDLNRILYEASLHDPDLRHDPDPLFDDQNWPDKGFEFDAIQDDSRYITVKGKDWPEFKLTIKVKELEEVWKIDGCGQVNIPEKKRAKK